MIGTTEKKGDHRKWILDSAGNVVDDPALHGWGLNRASQPRLILVGALDEHGSTQTALHRATPGPE
jgi:hypothetical protein